MTFTDSTRECMSPKERMFRVLAGERPDVLPAAPGYPSLFLADFERGFYVERYRARMHDLGCDRYAVDHEEDTLFRAQALHQSYGIFKARPDWIGAHRGAGRAWAGRTDIVVHEGFLYYEDRESGKRVAMHRAHLPSDDVELTEANPAATDIWDNSGEIRDTQDVDRLIPIHSVEQILARGHLDLVRRVVADYGHHTFIFSILDTPFSYVSNHLGFYGLMTIQHDRPKLLQTMLERQLAQTQEVMAALAAVGVHGIYVQEVFTGADMISPRAYDEFVFEYNRPYFHHMRRLGLLPIHYVCGDAVPRLERMVECDVAAVAVEESKKNFQIEIEDVVERVAGRAVVFGNIDAVKFGLHATMDEMAAEVRRQARIGARAMGFVVSTGSPFPLDTNPRLVDTLVTTAHSLRG
jgi:uroporphyrinogen-III decarboxylase